MWRPQKFSKNSGFSQTNQSPLRDTRRDSGPSRVNGLRADVGHTSQQEGKEKPGARAIATGSCGHGFENTNTTTHGVKYTNPKRDGQQFSERHKAFSRTAVYCLTDIEARGSANTLAFVAQKRLTRKERLFLTHALLQSLGDEDSELAVIEWARTYADMGVRV